MSGCIKCDVCNNWSIEVIGDNELPCGVCLERKAQDREDWNLAESRGEV